MAGRVLDIFDAAHRSPQELPYLGIDVRSIRNAFRGQKTLHKMGSKKFQLGA